MMRPESEPSSQNPDSDDHPLKPSQKAAGEALFASPVRRELFEILCQRPGSHLSVLAGTVEISPPAVRWHLQRMINAGFVAEAKIGKNMIFYPRGMIDPNHVSIFKTLAQPDLAMMLSLIRTQPGLSQKVLAESVGLSPQQVIHGTNKLSAHRLITSRSEGRSKRYYPTQVLTTLVDQYRTRSEKFVAGLVKQLRNDGIRVLSKTEADKVQIITISIGTSVEQLRIPMGPLPRQLSE